jgi:hypothetical protein
VIQVLPPDPKKKEKRLSSVMNKLMSSVREQLEAQVYCQGNAYIPIVNERLF